jgi:hypothetical protein
MLGAIEAFPVPSITVTVPVEVVYQSIVLPVTVVALKVTVPLPQRALLLGLVGAPGRALTVIVPVAAEAVQLLLFFRVTL